MQGKEIATRDTRKRSRSGQKGFTIVEIMVVIVIIGMLATVVVSNVLGDVDTAKLNTVKQDLTTLSEASTRYYLRLNSWPETAEDLVNPESGPSFIKQARLDPWRNEYQFEGVNEKGDGVFIRCAGNDKEYETEDDITTENFMKLTELPKINTN